MTFRACDVVRHHPSGEKWLLACDEREGDVWPAGWPETRAQASDCELVTAATDAARLKMLAAVANSRLDPRAPSRRRSIAASQLEDK
jgi:hypothetical protein